MTEHRIYAYQAHRWGPLKWHGNVVTYHELRESPFESLGVEDVDGYWAWSRAGLLRKLSRIKRRYEREQAWREAVEPQMEEWRPDK